MPVSAPVCPDMNAISLLHSAAIPEKKPLRTPEEAVRRIISLRTDKVSINYFSDFLSRLFSISIQMNNSFSPPNRTFIIYKITHQNKSTYFVLFFTNFILILFPFKKTCKGKLSCFRDLLTETDVILSSLCINKSNPRNS